MISIRQLLFSTGIVMILSVACDQKEERQIVGGTGTIEAREVKISPIMPARISEIHFDEGDRVKKGEILVTLVNEEVQAGVDFSQAGIDAARRQASTAKANLDHAKVNLTRAKELFRAGAMSKQKLDQASTGYEIARSTYGAALARVRQLQAGLAQAENRLRESYLSSPIDGIILSRNFYSGEVALPGSAVLSVADLSLVDLQIYVPEPILYKIQIGSPAKVFIDGTDQTLMGEVVRVADRAEFTPQNVQTDDARANLVFSVKIRIPNKELLLKPGMPVRAKILESIQNSKTKKSTKPESKNE